MGTPYYPPCIFHRCTLASVQCSVFLVLSSYLYFSYLLSVMLSSFAISNLALQLYSSSLKTRFRLFALSCPLQAPFNLTWSFIPLGFPWRSIRSSRESSRSYELPFSCFSGSGTNLRFFLHLFFVYGRSQWLFISIRPFSLQDVDEYFLLAYI